MEILKKDDINAATARACHISIHYPEFYNYLIENFPKELTFSERLYWYYNNIEDYPKCKICGQRTKFINSKIGYREFCSPHCMNSCKDIRDKKKKTSLKHYGVENPMQCEKVRDKLAKNNLDKFGVENPFSSDEIKKHIRETNIIKYGVPYAMQNKTIAKKVSNTNINKILKKYEEFISYDDEKELYRVICPYKNCDKCSEKFFDIPYSVFYDRKINGSEICTKLLPINFQHLTGSSIELFVRKILDKHNIEYQNNVRNIIAPKELDIYIPSYNLAIECNGVYWHNDLKKSNKYHYEKYKECEEKGIQLLIFWEDWIINKREIVESIILSKLGIYERRIYARKCTIKEVSVKDSNQFLEHNHIQGKCSSKIRLGLYHNNELISIMTFKIKNRMHSNKKYSSCYDLTRFCNKIGYQIIGGASKLLNYFIKNYHPKMIESFSSNDISNGNLYVKLGFKKISENSSYWYIDKYKKRYHRSNFTKDDIVKKGWKENKSGWTESEVMFEHGYYCIYDSGQIKWVLKIS